MAISLNHSEASKRPIGFSSLGISGTERASSDKCKCCALRQKLQINMAICPSPSTPTQGRSVLAQTQCFSGMVRASSDKCKCFVLRQKLQINMTICPSHAMPTQGRSVLARTQGISGIKRTTQTSISAVHLDRNYRSTRLHLQTTVGQHKAHRS